MSCLGEKVCFFFVLEKWLDGKMGFEEMRFLGFEVD